MQTMKHERFTKLNARFYVFFNFLDCDSEMHTKVYFNHAGILFPIHRQSEIKYRLLLDFSLSVKAAPHECVIKTGQL